MRHMMGPGTKVSSPAMIIRWLTEPLRLAGNCQSPQEESRHNGGETELNSHWRVEQRLEATTEATRTVEAAGARSAVVEKTLA